MNRKQISYHELDNIYNFIRESIYDLNRLGCQTHEIVIAIPNWFKELLFCYNKQRFPTFTWNDSNQVLFFGVKIQYHYTDEIVVFFQDYHFDRETFKAVIHVIKFENEK